MKLALAELKNVGKRGYFVAFVVALCIVVLTLLAGMPLEWYREPYSSFGKAIAWGINMPEEAYNFASVVPGKLYRSGKPDAEFLKYIQRHYGIKHVVSLVGPLEVHRTARQLGMDVMVVNWRLKPPTTQELTRLLDYLDENDRVLVHCFVGRDRTGYVIALYRMLRQGWPLDRAYQEMEEHWHSHSRRSDTLRNLQRWSVELAQQ